MNKKMKENECIRRLLKFWIKFYNLFVHSLCSQRVVIQRHFCHRPILVCFVVFVVFAVFVVPHYGTVVAHRCAERAVVLMPRHAVHHLLLVPVVEGVGRDHAHTLPSWNRRTLCLA